jgi:hypothetical protein
MSGMEVDPPCPLGKVSLASSYIDTDMTTEKSVFVWPTTTVLRAGDDFDLDTGSFWEGSDFDGAPRGR